LEEQINCGTKRTNGCEDRTKVEERYNAEVLVRRKEDHVIDCDLNLKPATTLK